MTVSMLFAQIRERIMDPGRATEGAALAAPSPQPPATETAVDAAEEALGFALPSLLRRLYLEVGNGGFGPGYGLLGVPGGAIDDPFRDIVGAYQIYTSSDEDAPSWQWPSRLLPICHLGCAMSACVDCADSSAPVIWWEPNPREDGDPMDLFLIPVAPSLEDWLWSWIRGEDWMSPAYAASALFRWIEEQHPQQD